MIRVTLTAMPRRPTLLAAKAAVLTALVLAAGALAVLGSVLAGRLILPANGFTAAHGYALLSLGHGPTLRAAVGSVLYLGLIALLSLGVATAVREPAVAIGIVLGLLLRVPDPRRSGGRPEPQAPPAADRADDRRASPSRPPPTFTTSRSRRGPALACSPPGPRQPSSPPGSCSDGATREQTAPHPPAIRLSLALADPGIGFPGESSEYRRARNELLESEIELRRAIERVAAQRRALPPGGDVSDDYRFQQATDGGAEVKLSELFAPGKDTLVIYSFMFPRSPGDTRPGPVSGETARLPLAETPCPSCTSILDSLDGAAPHLAQRVNLTVVAKSDPERIRKFARERGWRHLRLLSSAQNTYNHDYRAESPEGAQIPILNVFVRDGDRSATHGPRSSSSRRETRAKTPGMST